MKVLRLMMFVFFDEKRTKKIKKEISYLPTGTRSPAFLLGLSAFCLDENVGSNLHLSCARLSSKVD